MICKKNHLLINEVLSFEGLFQLIGKNPAHVWMSVCEGTVEQCCVCMSVSVCLIKDKMSFCVLFLIEWYRKYENITNINKTNDTVKPVWIIEWILLSIHYTCGHGVRMFLINDCIDSWANQGIQEAEKAVKLFIYCSSGHWFKTLT